MAWIFVRLKLRTLRSRLATSSLMALVGFVVLWLLALGGGFAVGGLFAAAMRLFADHRLDVLSAGFNLLGLAWIVVPIIAASLDDSLEPRRFELLPLTRRHLATGLLVASVIGPGGLATFLVLGFGMVMGIGSGTAIVPLLVIALVAVLSMAATARVFTTLLSDLLRRRRAQEVVALTMGVLFALPGLVSVAISEGGLRVGQGGTASAVLAASAWTPFGWSATSAAAVAEGRWADAVLRLMPGLAFLGLTIWAFGRALDRLQTRTPDAGPRAVAHATALMPRRIPLPAGPVGGVAAKELRYLRRDVRVRSQLLGGAIAVVVIGVTGGMTVLRTPFAPFLATAAVFLVVASVIPNQFGFDGGSFWGYMTTVRRLGDVIRGKNLGWALVAFPVAVFFAVAGGLGSGRWVYVPAALMVSAGVLLVWMAVGNLSSIYGALRLPDSNLFGNRNMSGSAFVFSVLGMFTSGVLTLPLALAVGVSAWRWGPAAATGGAVIGLLYSILVYRIGLGLADRAIERRATSLLVTIDGER